MTRGLITGGVEKALLAMLARMPYDEVDVDLFVCELGGELERDLPLPVRLAPLLTVHPRDAYRHPGAALAKAAAMARVKMTRPSFAKECRLSARMLLPLPRAYDIAVSYHAPNTVPVFYTLDRVRAARKILWLHGDLESNGGLTPLLLRAHERYDAFCAVSRAVQSSFLAAHPARERDVTLFYNFVDEETILRQSQQGDTFPPGFEGLQILSIGRLARQKGFDIAVRAASRLRDDPAVPPFRWTVLGEGEERAALTRQIAAAGLQEVFFLPGNAANPYRYLRDCDLYVQPSRTEGYCLTLSEARVLRKPIVVNDFPAAHEQIEDGVTGYIVPIEQSGAALASRVASLLTDPAARERASAALSRVPPQTDALLREVFELPPKKSEP